MFFGNPVRKTRRLALPIAAALGALLVPAAAEAGPLVASAPDCERQRLSNPFLPWLDPMDYTMPGGADGGAFEDRARGWTLSGDAAVVPGNEPFYVHGDRDSRSLALPPGSSAVSTTLCVGLEHPTLRFFARNQGSPLSRLRVRVHFEDAAGDVQTATIGTLAAGQGWDPTAPLPVTVNLLTLLPGEYTPVAFEFTPQGAGGEWRIDDVYVDPRHRS